MCSRNKDEVEAVRNELLKAGIPSEIRPDPISEAMGVSAVELWVQEERNFFDASKLFARIQGRTAGKPIAPATNPQGDSSERHFNGSESSRAREPRRDELTHARSVLEKGIAEMFARETVLTGECASLRSKVQELTQRQAALESERSKWQQQLKSRDDSLKFAQEKLDSMSQQLQTQLGAAAALREQLASLEQQRDEQERSFCNARSEALAERKTRIAAEERAQRAALALEKQLVDQTELGREIQAHVASLDALFRRVDTKGAAVV